MTRAFLIKNIFIFKVLLKDAKNKRKNLVTTKFLFKNTRKIIKNFSK